MKIVFSGLMIALSILGLLPAKASAFLDDIESEYALKKSFIREIRRAETGEGYKAAVFRCREGDVRLKVKTASVSSGTTNLDGLIIRTSSKYRVDPALVKALVHVESFFITNAVSHAGAIGLTQVMPTTAEELGVRPSDLKHPHVNLDTGVKYLSIQLDRFDSLKKALIAYNAGPNVASKVKRPEDIYTIPYETRMYVNRILNLYSMYRQQGFGINS